MVTERGTHRTWNESCLITMAERYCRVFSLQCSRAYTISLLPKTEEGFGRRPPSRPFLLPPCGRGEKRVLSFGKGDFFILLRWKSYCFSARNEIAFPHCRIEKNRSDQGMGSKLKTVNCIIFESIDLNPNSMIPVGRLQDLH